MKFKIGQRVSFLNEQRNGIVTKIINAQMVNVEIEDNFEIPVLINELVSAEPLFENFSEPVYQPKQPSSFQNNPSTNTTNDNDEDSEEIPRKSIINLNAKNELPVGYHIAYACEDYDINSTYFYVYFINNTSSDAIFTYALKKENKFIDIDYEKVPAHSKVILDIIDRSQLDEWAAISFQIIQFNQNGTSINRPIVGETFVHPVKIFKGQSFNNYKIIPHAAIIKQITSDTIAKNEDITNFNNEIKESKTHKKIGIKVVGHINDIVNKDNFPAKHLISKGFAEVDLHIDEIIENIEGMTNERMFQTQINYFKKMLDTAITNHLQRIIFIHGIGNGKLKESIRNIITNDYPKLEIFDASMAKYGKGATEIKIPVNL